MRTRAERRHHSERKKKEFFRRQRAHPYWAATTNVSAGIYANHGCSCSCPMCGNPRKHFGTETIQEKKKGEPDMDACREYLHGDMYLCDGERHRA